MTIEAVVHDHAGAIHGVDTRCEASCLEGPCGLEHIPVDPGQQRRRAQFTRLGISRGRRKEYE